MDPMYLADVEAFRGVGPRAEAIERMRAAGQPIPQIMHLFAFKPDRTDHLAAFTQGVMRGPSPLSPGQRELIAALTSKLNQCLFWIGSHAAVAAELLGDRELVASVLAGDENEAISGKDRALYMFVRKMVHDSLSIGPDDVAAAHAEGWTDEALYDAISVVALFQFYNAWIDATGVRDMSALGYEMSGKRLSTQGYVMR
jgi:uncharacterized peroxidase-related enzyme